MLENNNNESGFLTVSSNGKMSANEFIPFVAALKLWVIMMPKPVGKRVDDDCFGNLRTTSRDKGAAADDGGYFNLL